MLKRNWCSGVRWKSTTPVKEKMKQQQYDVWSDNYGWHNNVIDASVASSFNWQTVFYPMRFGGRQDGKKVNTSWPSRRNLFLRSVHRLVDSAVTLFGGTKERKRNKKMAQYLGLEYWQMTNWPPRRLCGKKKTERLKKKTRDVNGIISKYWESCLCSPRNRYALINQSRKIENELLLLFLSFFRALGPVSHSCIQAD